MVNQSLSVALLIWMYLISACSSCSIHQHDLIYLQPVRLDLRSCQLPALTSRSRLPQPSLSLGPEGTCNQVWGSFQARDCSSGVAYMHHAGMARPAIAP